MGANRTANSDLHRFSDSLFTPSFEADRAARSTSALQRRHRPLRFPSTREDTVSPRKLAAAWIFFSIILAMRLDAR
jgi:hypothetical protein